MHDFDGIPGIDQVPVKRAAWHYFTVDFQRESFADYLTELGKRKPGVNVAAHLEIDLFTKHFGPPDDAFHRSWIDYMVKLRLDRREAGR